MRLWSVHPRYLDARGLVALWRESLLARRVLAGETRGYRFHPQLERFRQTADPLLLIDAYLLPVFEESVKRGYRFDQRKLRRTTFTERRITVTDGQLRYEWNHLKGKLKVRAPERYRRMRGAALPAAHPLFMVTAGPVECWERFRSGGG